MDIDEIDLKKLIMTDLDYENCYRAALDLIDRMRSDETEYSDEIEAARVRAERATGIYEEIAIDDHIDLMHFGVYRHASHSMAAVGVIAPLIETLFRRLFDAIGDKLPNERFVENVISKTKTASIKKHMPDRLDATLQAIFAYRNKMFHSGLEWPVSERANFVNNMEKNAWDEEWFSFATTGNEVWIVYMSESFIDHCLEIINQAIKGIVAFRNEVLKDRLERTGRSASMLDDLVWL